MDRGHEGESQSMAPRRRVTCDQEAWLLDRLRTLVKMAGDVARHTRVPLDFRVADAGIDGLVHGTAVEIIDILGLEPGYENIQEFGGSEIAGVWPTSRARF